MALYLLVDISGVDRDHADAHVRKTGSLAIVNPANSLLLASCPGRASSGAGHLHQKISAGADLACRCHVPKRPRRQRGGQQGQ